MARYNLKSTESLKRGTGQHKTPNPFQTPFKYIHVQYPTLISTELNLKTFLLKNLSPAHNNHSFYTIYLHVRPGYKWNTWPRLQHFHKISAIEHQKHVLVATRKAGKFVIFFQCPPPFQGWKIIGPFYIRPPNKCLWTIPLSWLYQLLKTNLAW